MAYSTSTPPILVAGGVGGTPRVWMYVSTDANTAVDAAGYFTNGYALGMRAGDLVLVQDSDDLVWYGHSVITATSTSVDLGAGVAISSATNAD
jgi:lipid-binding SYLF domain-containing protein